ncbi:tripartite tricarboxylate transporter TctB family protein [Alkalihalobacillus sp. BA299]|uniref:tripartite tricarboxylate transporter TctB family protein n=1 Tax=Alkalihalobacillus sp. BA299 TaxID=2815938 RepID=UPI001ADA32D7|nr:tripartite tricarboxylate transporter TctB family protein [Alkalihalobacillus sp. BA299]
MVNRIFSILVLVVAGIFFIESRGFSEKTGMQTFAPSFFPSVIIIVMSILALSLFIQSFKDKQKDDLLKSLKVYIIEHWRVVITLILLVIYISLLPIIGFLISTMLFLLMVFAMLGPIKRQYLVVNVLLAVILPFGIQWVFQSILKIYLP